MTAEPSTPLAHELAEGPADAAAPVSRAASTAPTPVRAGSLPDCSVELDAESSALLGLAPRIESAALARHVHPADRARIESAFDTLLCTLGPVVTLLRVKSFDGAYRSMALRLRYSSGAILLRVTEITDLAPHEVSEAASPFDRLDRARRRSEALLALAAIATRDAIWEWRLVDDVHYVSPRLAELLGFEKDGLELHDGGFAALLHPDDVAAERDARRRHLDERARYDVDVRLRTATGDYRWFRAVGETLRDENGSALSMAGMLSDVDALKFAERELIGQRNELEAMTRQLHDMSLRLVNSQEDERRHIARELHDQTGQTLTAAVLDLEYWRGRSVPPEEIDRVLVEVRRALGEVRDISLRLRPPLLDEAGLENALRAYLERQGEAARFEVAFATEGMSTRLPAEIEITAFRLVQEAVTNIVRHANAQHVDVSLKIAPRQLTIRISDDGDGCVAPAAMSNATKGSSLGLISMNERAALLGGHCEFLSMPGAGSIVLARIPLR